MECWYPFRLFTFFSDFICCSNDFDLSIISSKISLLSFFFSFFVFFFCFDPLFHHHHLHLITLMFCHFHFHFQYHLLMTLMFSHFHSHFCLFDFWILVFCQLKLYLINHWINSFCLGVYLLFYHFCIFYFV